MRSTVEGAIHKLHDRGGNCVRVLHDILCIHPNHAMSILFQKSSPARVPFRTVADFMCKPIDLDHQPVRGAIEIDDIGADRMPLAKLLPCLLSAQPLP